MALALGTSELDGDDDAPNDRDAVLDAVGEPLRLTVGAPLGSSEALAEGDAPYVSDGVAEAEIDTRVPEREAECERLGVLVELAVSLAVDDEEIESELDSDAISENEPVPLTDAPNENDVVGDRDTLGMRDGENDDERDADTPNDSDDVREAEADAVKETEEEGEREWK